MSFAPDYVFGLRMETEDAIEGILNATALADKWFWNWAEGFNGREPCAAFVDSICDSGARWDDKRMTWIFPDGSFGRVEWSGRNMVPVPANERLVFQAGVDG